MKHKISQHTKIFNANTIGWIILIVGFALNSRLGIAVGCMLAATNWYRLGWKKKAAGYLVVGLFATAILTIIAHVWDSLIISPTASERTAIKVIFHGVLILLTMAILEKRVKAELATIGDQEIQVEGFSFLTTLGITGLNIVIAWGFTLVVILGFELVMAPRVEATSKLILDGNQTIMGSIEPWSNEPIANRELALCQLTGNLLTPYDCHITSYTAQTGPSGEFQLEDVAPGKYLVIYDTGMADFQEGIISWQGQEIRPGNQSWAIDHWEQLYKDCGNDFYLITPDGKGAIGFYFRRPHYVYNLCGAYFFLAHDIETAMKYEGDHHRKRLPNGVFIPTVIEVVPGYNSVVTFDVLYKQR